MKNQKGFTLIEVLVVISIIALLSSLVATRVLDSKAKASIASGQSFATSLDHTLMSEAVWALDFEEANGSSAMDSSGYSNTANIYGTFTRQPAILGNGVFLNTDSGVEASASYFGENEFTISFWVKPDGLYSADGQWSNPLVFAGNYPSTGFRMGINGDGQVVFWTTESSGTIEVVSNISLSTKRFNHVAVTYNGTKAVMYIDGKNAGSDTGTYVPADSMEINTNMGFGRAYNKAYDSVRFFKASSISK